MPDRIDLTPFAGGGTIYTIGGFCAVNFCRSMFSSLRVVSLAMRKLVKCKISN